MFPYYNGCMLKVKSNFIVYCILKSFKDIKGRNMQWGRQFDMPTLQCQVLGSLRSKIELDLNLAFKDRLDLSYNLIRTSNLKID